MSDMDIGLWGQGKWWNTRFWHSNQQTSMNEMADGMRAVLSRSTERMDQIAENLANASTPGFRSACVLPKNFIGELNGRLVGHQWRVGTDMTPGSVRLTDRALDFALQGDGFFAVRSPHGEFLTRNGSFEVAADGTLSTVAGYAVLGIDNQPINIPATAGSDKIDVGEDGIIAADGVEVGQLRLERVEKEDQLRRVGTTLFATEPENRLPAENTRVVGRALESSNSSVYQELADMMVLSRSVEASQRAQSDEVQSQKKMMDVLS